MIGGIEETSASCEARSAPRSYPTGGGRPSPATRWARHESASLPLTAYGPSLPNGKAADRARRQRAAKLAEKYGVGAALARYCEIVLRTVRSRDPAAGPGAT